MTTEADLYSSFGDLRASLKETLEKERRENHMSAAADAAELWDYLREEGQRYPSIAGALIRIMHRHQGELQKEGVVIEGLSWAKEDELAFMVGSEEKYLLLPPKLLRLEEAQKRAKQIEGWVYPVVNRDGVPQRCLPPAKRAVVSSL